MSSASTQSQSWSVLPDGVVVYGILSFHHKYLCFFIYMEVGKG